MKYHGGKQRIGGILAEKIYHISNKISNERDVEIKGYCEPFCGMLGVYRHIPDLFDNTKLKYKAGDVNISVIMMWQALQRGWKPVHKLTKTQYNKLKQDGAASAEKGFYGHAYTYRGEFLDTYFPHQDSTIKHNVESVCDIAEDLNFVKFSEGSYTQFSRLKGYVIYCDPPYQDTISRYSEGKNRELLKFNSDNFWRWCENMSENNIVIISSYKAPKNFKKVFSLKTKITGIRSKNIRSKNIRSKNRVEKLFILK